MSEIIENEEYSVKQEKSGRGRWACTCQKQCILYDWTHDDEENGICLCSILGPLFGFLLVSWLSLWIGGLIMGNPHSEWYDGLKKPVLNPPDWIFGLVWSILGLLYGVSGWLVWLKNGFCEAKRVFFLYAVQLFLIPYWIYVFFVEHNLFLATVVTIWMLAIVSVIWIAFRRRSRAAGMMLVPYVCWLLFALLMSWEFWRMNVT